MSTDDKIEEFFDRVENSEVNPERCYFCESTDELEEHHILPQRFQGRDRRDNLVTVCHDCHWKLERLYNKDFYAALGIEDPRATAEMHVKCMMPDCTEQAVTKVQFPHGGGFDYYCDAHKDVPNGYELRNLDVGGDDE